MKNSILTAASRGASPWGRVMLTLAVMLSALAFAGTAHAIELGAAKAQKLVGEQADGYLGIPNPPGSAEVQRLVADTNLRRRERYQAIASENGTSLAAVEAVAGKKLVEMAAPGEMVRDSSGNWVEVR